MLSLAEFVDLIGLSRDEVDLIAEHEGIPDIVAAEMGFDLLKTQKGIYRLHCIFLECLERAKLAGQKSKARQIDRIYTQFRATYPMPRRI